MISPPGNAAIAPPGCVLPLRVWQPTASSKMLAVFLYNFLVNFNLRLCYNGAGRKQ